MLHSVFVCCIKNRPLRLIMETVSRDGREALRKLDAEYRPTCSADSDAGYIDKLSEWHQVVREYERIPGKELDQTVKTATLIDEVPPQMQEHLRLRSKEIGTDNKKVILAVEVTCARRKLGILEARLTQTLAQSTRAKVSPKEKGRARPKVRTTKAEAEAKAKAKAMQPKNNENSKSDRKCFRLCQTWTFSQRL